MVHVAPFVVIAEFEVRPGAMPAFLALAHDDARCSRETEAGCRRFDVVQLADTHRVLFYELYDDRSAFDLHLQTPHLKRFLAGFPALVVRELPVRFGGLCSGTRETACRP